MRPLGSNAVLGSAPASNWSSTASGITGCLRRAMGHLLCSHHAQAPHEIPDSPHSGSAYRGRCSATRRRCPAAEGPLDYFGFKPGQPALLLLDIDVKTLPPAIHAKIVAAGGVAAVLEQV